MARLTDLEHTVLGIVWKRAPCTAYRIMREFATSPSSHWRGSAGAIYPLTQRLEEHGYLTSCAESRGRRPRRAYRVTRKGVDALRRWLQPPVPDDDAGITFDPIRTRAYFLKLVSEEDWSALLADAEEKTRRQIEVVAADAERYSREGDRFSALAMRGGVFELQARLAWLREVRKQLLGRA